MGIYPGRDIDLAAACAGCAAGCGMLQEEAREPGGDGARSHTTAARIIAVLPESPADDAGFAPGCFITSVDGQPVRDLIDWRWLTDGYEITLGYIDLDGEAGEVDLERWPGEDWGFEFDGVVFDGVRQCRNACTFCFMRQLPEGLRPSLSLRDDDFRLSFLSGTFVTLTNVSPEQERRILEQAISPLRWSLHAVDADVRKAIIGKHAAHGLDVAQRLLAGGIKLHAQIVLMPGVNDGDVLRETLTWAYAHPGIEDVCVVPLGYTKHQARFTRSFDAPQAAQEVLALLAPFQETALAQRGTPWVFAADEFYLNAYGDQVLESIPPASFYGDFAMYEDGVGIVRAFVDDWRTAVEEGRADVLACALHKANARARLIQGEAMRPVLEALVPASPLEGLLVPLYVKNDFFGGNVDVTGLLCACDVAAAVRKSLREGENAFIRPDASRETGAGEQASVTEGAFIAGRQVFALPRVVLNDEGVTLDGANLQDLQKAASAQVAVVSCNPSEYFGELAALVEN